MVGKEKLYQREDINRAKTAWLMPGIFIVSFVGICSLIYVPWAAEGASGWVQAAGSILALIVAIAVPYRFRVDDDKARDDAHAMRLYTVIWEALEVTNNRLTHELRYHGVSEATEKLQKQLPWRLRFASTPFMQVLQQDVDPYLQIMQRASTNLDDDLSAERLVIAARFRRDLSGLIITLSSRVGAIPDGSGMRLLDKGHESFDEHLRNLLEVSPRLKGTMVR